MTCVLVNLLCNGERVHKRPLPELHRPFCAPPVGMLPSRGHITVSNKNTQIDMQILLPLALFPEATALPNFCNTPPTFPCSHFLPFAPLGKVIAFAAERQHKHGLSCSAKWIAFPAGLRTGPPKAHVVSRNEENAKQTLDNNIQQPGFLPPLSVRMRICGEPFCLPECMIFLFHHFSILCPHL